MAWFALILAGMFEIVGVSLINQFNLKRNWYSLAFVVLGFGVSFFLLSFAMKTIPMGTAYAIWTGIGTAGSAIIGIMFYGESNDWKRMLFIAMVLGSVIGLKLVS
ncbi:multidrug efflux SMR transporter [Robertmurraya korlensis]|uniref:DMT family transporter n=1 Tax=Robertmurraya korlensis TaxID=519977 RepID=UPI00203AB5D5|nr:multidrug efflux SMR transporter [Robertmurraya korlensis]MCM3601328.1 multidrug efflux SMR transporter [Robertmurraya korlensis]